MNKKHSNKINHLLNPRVAVAMSGGVDSAVAAALLKAEGYDVIGVFMQFWFPKGETYGENRCCSLASFNQAKETAGIIGIPIYKLNAGRDFKNFVVDDFLADYKKGLTPNPCVACNKFIKFDWLWKQVKSVWDVDFLATGHYCRLCRQETKNKKQKTILLRGLDEHKDQSYFLYNLNQKILPYLLFPVGDYIKPQVRKLAKKFKLPVYDKEDSQEICFVGKSHYDFLKKYLKPKAGDIVDELGDKLGRHQGLPLYAIGQRTGLGLSGGPWYVCGFDRENNRLTVSKNQNNSGIFQKELRAEKINWTVEKPKFPLKCQAQIRYRMKPAECVVEKSSRGLKVEFAKKQRAIMPGQSVVFYDGDEVLGGGIIINLKMKNKN